MKKLTKEMEDKRDDIATELDKAFTEIESVFSELSDTVAMYNAKVLEFNNKMADMREFIGEVTAAMDEYMDEKSEKWAESEPGERYSEWRSAWEDIDTDDLEQLEELTDPTDTPQSAVSDELQGLPSAPE
jgi:uncharacterized coiled-coil DUF342 family protein